MLKRIVPEYRQDKIGIKVEISYKKCRGLYMKNWDILANTEVLVNQKRVNICEHTVKMAPHKSHRTLSLLCVHGYSPSFNRQRPQWMSKYLNYFPD